MSQKCIVRFTLAVAVCFGIHASADATNVYITEFCSDTGNNEHFEFVEFTNIGSTPVNMTGWSEDDSNATPGTHSLSGFGTLAPHESAILTEATPSAFMTYWSLPATVKVVGGYTNHNLSTTSDSITLFDGTGMLVDRLDYSTTNGGSADEVTRNAPLSALGLNDNSLWANSFIGDSFGSYRAHALPGSSVIFGNPGSYPTPEPSSFVLASLGALGLICVIRWRARMAHA